MAHVPFIKMHGAGNDFVIVFNADLPASIDIKQLVLQMAHRRFGIGADQILLLRPYQSTFEMVVYNADGSTAEMCGNGLRCVASHLHQLEKVKGNEFEILTGAGMRQIKVAADGSIEVNMGQPVFLPNATVHASGIDLKGEVVSMGNPHFVIFTDAKTQGRVAELGPIIEHDGQFPHKTNVMLVRPADRQTLQVAHWERGSGLTLACGTGACASAAAAIKTGQVQSPVTVKMSGGEIVLRWQGPGTDIWMSGPLATVFSGEFSYNRS